MTALQDIHMRTFNLLCVHARNVDSDGNIINKELEPISGEIKSAMWDLVDAIDKESRDGKTQTTMG